MPNHRNRYDGWPSRQANPSDFLQSLKERTALFILKNLKQNSDQPWCQKTYRVWLLRHEPQERTEASGETELHAWNPVKRRLVSQPGDWALVELEVLSPWG